MDLNYTPEEERFRERVRSFLQANLPQGWASDNAGAFGRPNLEFMRDWTRKLYENGFLGMSWPKEYGGGGATQIEVAIFNEEMARFRAPTPLNFMGLTMVGPTLIAHGNEEQKKRFINKILTGEELWCQGF